MEEGVEEENDIVLDRDAVEEDGLRWCVECIRHESRLDHDQGVVHILFVENVSISRGQKFIQEPQDRSNHLPVESSLIWRVVEDLQELTSPQMEHELRIDAEIVREPETRRVFFSVIRELLA